MHVIADVRRDSILNNDFILIILLNDSRMLTVHLSVKEIQKLTEEIHALKLKVSTGKLNSVSACVRASVRACVCVSLH